MTNSDPLTLHHYADPPPASLIRELSTLQARAYATVGMRGWSASEITETIRSPAGRALVACGSDGEVRGFLLATVPDRNGEVLILAVDPACRRSNVGTRLVNELVSGGTGIELEFVILEVAAINITARKFYDMLNFHEIGIRKNYYLIDGRRVDAQLLRRDISKKFTSIDT